MTQRCDECVNSAPPQANNTPAGSTGLQCRRYAPRPNGSPVAWSWPFVKPDDYCAEFSRSMKGCK